MGIFLQIVSAIYLVLVWLAAIMTLRDPAPLASTVGDAAGVFTVMIAVLLSIPAAILFGFGQIVSDIRVIRHLTRTQAEDLRAVRRYSEPR